MTLSEMLKEYRANHGMSQRQLAIACGLSNGYISMLEKGMNPNTKQPVTPTIPVLKKLATGMGLSMADLFSMADDMPVDLELEELTELNDIISKELSALIDEGGLVNKLDIEIVSLILKLPLGKKQEALRYLRYLADYKDK